MKNYRGLTITELIVVLAIIAALISLLLPAVVSMRERARETACKNNLRQMHIALLQLVETTKELPPRSAPGEFGGWMVAILPFMEQTSLKNSISIGSSISDSPQFNRPPSLYVCPVRGGMDGAPSEGMWPAHYILATAGKRNGGSLYDAPVALQIPWGSSPEMTPTQVRNSMGPHHRGFYFIQSELHGVEYCKGNQPENRNHAELRIEREDRWPIQPSVHSLATVPR